MSTFEADPTGDSAEAATTATMTPDGPVRELLAGREVVLGGSRAMGTAGMPVVRTLPNKIRRMVGPWCFVDHFGPADGTGMDVPPHPHTGLQTVTWLLDGAVHHRDNLGSDQLIRPGQLNLMTSGRGIAHAEVSPSGGALHGVQLWVALPDADRFADPHFEHHAELPLAIDGKATVRVIMGSLLGISSPARTYSPMVGAQIGLARSTALALEVDPGFEYAVLPLTGPVEVQGEPVPRGQLVYLGTGRGQIDLAAEQPTQALLVGGEPFGERLVMWWNFVARSHDEIVADREDWQAGRRFGPVSGYDGARLPAPPMPTTRLVPRGRTR